MYSIEEIHSRPIAVVGLGQIGMSWATYFMARGFQVHGSDPQQVNGHKTTEYAKAAWPILEELGLVVSNARPDSFEFDSDVEQVVAGCGWVQENAPENIELKIDLLARIDRSVSPEALIASSTSALPMTQMQIKCRYPARCVTAHPFNPPHLVPLVELVGGDATSKEALDISYRFYRSIEREPIRLNREIYGHVANRLQYVLFNEATRLVLDGVTTAADIDRAVSWGPGLRWPIMGPFMTFHVAGGAKGTLGAFEKFGPRDELVNDRAKRISLSSAEQQIVHEQVDNELGARTLQELEAERDQFLGKLYKLKREIERRQSAATGNLR